MTQLYTPEPWGIHKSSPTFIRANNGRKHVGNTDSMGNQETNEANARRIVAAVNACAGITTESLERGGVGSLLSLGLEEQRRGDDAERQRDELAGLSLALLNAIDSETPNHLRHVAAGERANLRIAAALILED